MHAALALGVILTMNDTDTPRIDTHAVDTPAGRIVYDVAGGGPRTVAFIHGAGAGRAQWHHQMAACPAGCRYIAIDLPGYGDSAAPETEYSLDLWVRGIVAVLDDAGVERVVLVGHSAGVTVVRHVLRRDPGRVAGVVLVDGALQQPLTPPIIAWMRDALNRPDYAAFMKTLADHMPRGRLTDADFDLITRLSSSTPRHVRAGELAAMTATAAWTPDPIRVPVLAIKATGPQAMPGAGDFEADLRAIAPHADYHPWTDVGHFLVLEEPERFNTLVERFVRRDDVAR